MKRSLFRLLAAVAVIGGVVAGPGAAAPASADPDAAACTVAGPMTYAPGLGPVPAAQAVGGVLTVTCLLLGDDVGVWTLPYAGTSFEDCLAGTGTELWGAGAIGPEGPVIGGGFTYVRVGIGYVMDLYGTIPVPGVAEVHTFVAHVTYLPTPFCLPPTAGAFLNGAGVILDV